ncbi:hypothetical protein C3L33_03466, partial [Rhododendron williamsianum]
MASKSFKASRLSLSTTNSDVQDSPRGRPPLPPTVTFARRSSSGQYSAYSRDDFDSEPEGSGYTNYTVHLPPTPDNQPMDAISQKVEEQYVSNSLFTGGFNSVTRAHLMDKVIESETNHPQMAGSKGSSCAIPGCDAKVMSDERGVDILPCECDFKICRDCYLDAVKAGDGICPGCKDPYKALDLDEVVETGSLFRFLHHRLRSNLLQLQLVYDIYSGKSKKAITRLLAFVRLVVLGLFLAWRVNHPNEDAVWLWGMSVVCELWFAFSWILDQLPKLCPVNRATDLNVLKEKFEMPSLNNPTGKSDLPGIDIFVSTADPEKEPPLVTANTILSILATDYPVEKLACYVSDDGGALLTFEAMAEAASFSNLWVPFCRKHDIEPRNPESYFNLKKDPYKNKVKSDFVKDRRRLKREYDEFKVRIKVMLNPPSDDPLLGTADDARLINLSEIDIRLPMLVYVSREKRPGYDHNKKAGAMNALVRASAIMSNGPFILNLDCDHYIYNSQALREGMCFMMDRGGDRICYVQFPQRFEGIDPSDRYANHNTVFFDGNMRALDGLQGPVYVGTGCLFRRIALYGFDPPRSKEHQPGCCGCCFPGNKKHAKAPEENRALRMGDSDNEEMNLSLAPKKFGNSTFLIDSIPVAEFQGRPLADHPAVKNGRPPGALTIPREILNASTVAEAIGSSPADVVTGYRMHNRGWKSVYCVTKRDAFRGTAPINLTDRLHQVLRWATGSVEIFFSRNNALLASSRMKFLQRVAYLNVGIYPFTSIFLIVYCFLPALSLFSGQFIVQTLSVTFLVYLLTITVTLCLLAVLEIKWSGVELEEWWRNEQFWLIGGTSAHLAAVLQGLLKVVAGIEISFTLTSKSSGDDENDEYADLYIVKWTSLMIPPLTIMMLNLIAIAVGVSRTIYSTTPEWSKLLGGVFFSFWVLAHMYPFAKGLMGRRGKTLLLCLFGRDLLRSSYPSSGWPSILRKAVPKLEAHFRFPDKSFF